MGKLLCYILLVFINSQLRFSSSTSSNDCSALLQLKNALLVINSTFNNCNDSSRHPTDTWKESTDCCLSWSRVTCDKSSRHVVDLDLSDSCLQGSISSNGSLFLLHHLQSLNLTNNNFSFSSIPSEFGKLNQLQSLDLSFSCFSGEIPDTFGNLSNLNELNLSGNNLSGKIPPSILSHKKLQVLVLGLNHLEGRLPHSISGLSNLNRLDFSHNMLSGRIPSWLFTIPSLDFLDVSYNNLTSPIDQFQLPNSVRKVFLQNNKIHGPIPRPLFELVNVTYLVLSSNNLSGVIDWSMFQNLPNLQVLDLSNNTELSLSNRVDVNFSLSDLETLNLSSCNITEFPTFLGTFQSLQSLDLSYNAIGGNITLQYPYGWESLSSLNLSHNFVISVEQHPWNNIKSLDLRWNSLQGPLIMPPASTEYFMVSNNQLSEEIPSSICDLTALKILDLSHNKLKGVVPQCTGNFSDSLSVIDLRNNTFHGSIPEIFENCTNLGILNIKHNNFGGKLPRSLVNCASLEILDLGSNNITDTFPHWLEPLSSLRVLILRANGFFGPIGHPEVEHPFQKLQILDLSHNKFTGPLPAIYLQNLTYMREANVNDNPGHVGGTNRTKARHLTALGPNQNMNDFCSGYKNLPCGKGASYKCCIERASQSDPALELDNTYYTSYIVVDVTMKGLEFEMKKILYVFTTIDISSNQFIGDIPPAIGMLKSLKVLNFSHNGFTGRIPSTLGNLMEIESLDLSSNKLGGEIPLSLTSLIFLEILNLSHNQLEGRIPRSNQFNTFSNESYIGNLGLCGFPMSNECEPPQVPPPRFDNEEDSEGWFNWKYAALMGYGCGLVLGLSIGYIMFIAGRPIWFVIFVERKPHEILRRQKGRCRRRRV